MTSEHRTFTLGVPVTSPFSVAVDGRFVNLQMFYYFPPEKSPFFLKKMYHLFFKKGRMYFLCYLTDVPPMSWGNESIMILADFVGDRIPFNPTLFKVPLNMRYIYVQRWATEDLNEFIKDCKDVDGKLVNYKEFVMRSKAMRGAVFLLDKTVDSLKSAIPEAVVSRQMEEISEIFEEAQKIKNLTDITKIVEDDYGEVPVDNGSQGADGKDALSDNALQGQSEKDKGLLKEASNDKSA
jgi:hypothetical protein